MKAMTFFLRKSRSMLRQYAANQAGAIAVLFAICLAVLIGMMALALDLARAYNLDTELQHAADAAALAGATQLDQAGDSINRACLAAIGGTEAACTTLTALTLVANTQTFATDALGQDVASFAITFMEDLTKDVDGSYLTVTTDPLLAAYIRVCVSPRTVNFMFAGVVGAVTSVSPDACAVAGMGAAYCQVPPMFICLPTDPPFEGQGVWMKGKDPGGGGGTSWFEGNFGLLALQDAAGNSLLSAALIRDAMGSVEPPGQCYGAGEDVQTKPGETTSIKKGMNIRFDIFENPMTGGGIQDNWLYQPAPNLVKGLLNPTGTKCDISNNGWIVPDLANRYTPATNPADILAMSYPRDTCAFTLADGGDASCMPAAGQGRFGSGEWEAETYMMVNHDEWVTLEFGAGNYATALNWLDLNFGDGDLGTPTLTVPITRYQVYEWELLTENFTENANESPRPTCFNDAGEANTLAIDDIAPPYADVSKQPGVDRRTICVAALTNCDTLGGGTVDVTPSNWVKLFLLEPVGIWGDNKSIYAEWVNTTDCNGPDTDIARNVVQLFE